MKISHFLVWLLLFPTSGFSENIVRESWGTVFAARVTDNNVNVRSSPSRESQVLGKRNKGDQVLVTGYSTGREHIDGYSGFWVRVSLSETAKTFWSEKNGWIFAKYVDIDQSISVSSFSVHKVVPATSTTSLSLELNIKRGLNSEIVTVAPRRLGNQEFYTFTWSDDRTGFGFSDPVGTFAWYPKNNTIEHVSYLGWAIESSWCLVTNDLKYLIQDYGTSPGPRSLAIFEIPSGRRVFSGAYYNDLDYDGKSIVVVQIYNKWQVEDKKIDKDSIEYARKFIVANPLSDENQKWKASGRGIDVIVSYRLDLDNFKLEFVHCSYRKVM